MSILDLNPRAQESDKTKKLINKHMQQTKQKQNKKQRATKTRRQQKCIYMATG